MSRATSKEELLTLLQQSSRETRWRLLLGKSAQSALGGAASLQAGLATLDAALGQVYESRSDGESQERHGDLSASAPKLAKWLGDIRKYFATDVVAVVQHDAIERQGLQQLLFEPEVLGQVTPSVELAATLLTFSKMISEETKQTAREVVRKVADEIVQKLRSKLERSMRGALNRMQHAPLRRIANFDVRRTIQRNLKHYNRERRQLLVEREYFFARQHRQFEWNVIVCLDTSGSMVRSVVYGAVMASIMASLKSLETHLVMFDTEVVDFSDKCHDPVDVMFGVQLGGGTDINRAVAYCEELVHEPRKTLMLLISDLEEGGNRTELVQRMANLVGGGVKVVSLLALDDAGTPAFDATMAKRLEALGIPCFACTPNRLPHLLAAAISNQRLENFMT